ncbi:MAG: hypothetical protein LCI00_01210 [Chloroflexi bacterium]|nr:hypothetical protein [Chloroflexota bacterium]MCC6895691.1 hypothetical protein [Anaerolineae bacterium]
MEKLNRKALNKAVVEIANALGETEDIPIEQIRKIIQLFGVEFARKILDETMTVEAQGGLMLMDQSRRRSTGGVYFRLIRDNISLEQQFQIFPTPDWKRKALIPKPVSVPLLDWTERLAIIERLRVHQGEIVSMKVQLVGRPGSVVKRPDVVVTTMSYVASMPILPHGIPIPPQAPTLYTVYMTPKQWSSVEKPLENPEDRLYIEGVCAPDPESNGMAIFVTLIRNEIKPVKLFPTPKEPAAPRTTSDAPTDTQGAAKPPKKSRFDDLPSQSGSPQAKANAKGEGGIPPEAAAKLKELYASASVFRQKLEAILAKPKGQQFGLEMTQKLLKNVQDEIAVIEGKHKR